MYKHPKHPFGRPDYLAHCRSKYYDVRVARASVTHCLRDETMSVIPRVIGGCIRRTVRSNLAGHQAKGHVGLRGIAIYHNVGGVAHKA